MKKTIAAFAALAAINLFAVPASERYVDEATNATLRAANAYTDAHGGGGSGGVNTNDVKAIINDEVGGTNTLVHSEQISDMETQTHASDTYQPKGDYLTSESDPSVPEWAKRTEPPESMPDNGLVLTNGSVKTKNGTSITPGHIGAATTEEQQETRAIVTTWEQFLDGSNVVFSITNYISGTYNIDAAKLRITELRDGAYRDVYNSRDEILLHIDHFSNSYVRVALDAVVEEVAQRLADKADRAWGNHTSAGGNAPSNTVYMTAPNTVFAGGMEYERVAVGQGAVCVLTTKGAPVYTQGDEGTFKFQDDGGTNYFGFAKTDSYVIGCNTDGITVQNQIVTLEYDVTMSGVPCIWYRESLEGDSPWVQCNTPDGEPISGAPKVVQWEQNPGAGKEICYINCEEASGFFKATIEVAGEAKFMTNMKADLNGGVLCTDGTTVIYPHANGTWSTTK